MMIKKTCVLLTVLALTSLMVSCGAESTGYMDLKWQYAADSAVVYVHVDDFNNDGINEIVAVASKQTMSGAAGWIYLLDREGNLKWEYPLPGSVTAFLVDDLNEDGEKDIIVGVSSYVHVINSTGNLAWRSKTAYRHTVRSLFTENLDNNGSKELIVGTTSSYKAGKLVIMNDKGRHMWVKPVSGGVYTLYAADLDMNGFKEVIVGTVGRYGVYDYPGYIQVFNFTGNEVWRYPTKKGVLSLSVYDVDGDGWGEVLAGCKEYFYVLNNYGEDEGNSSTKGRIWAVEVVDLGGEGDIDILLGSDKVYALDRNFKRKWISDVGGEVYDLRVADLDADGNPEVIVAADKLYVLDKKGEEIWQHLSTPLSVHSCDLDGDGYPELVMGSVDKNVYVFHSKTHIEKLDANGFYAKANELYLSGNYEEARANAENAKKIYSKLEMYERVKKCKELLDRIMNDESRVTKEKERAEEYYNRSYDAYLAGEYINATSYAQKAKHKYISLNDMENVDKCRDIINKSGEFLRLEANDFLENASGLFREEDYGNALLYAEKANEIYEFIKDEGAVNESTELINQINEYIEGGKEETPQVKDESITLPAIGLIVLVLIILAAAIITRKRKKKGKDKHETVMKKEEPETVMKEEEPEKKEKDVKTRVVEERKPGKKAEEKEKPGIGAEEEKKPVRREVRIPLSKIAKDSFRGEGSSLRSLMRK